jgi:DNA-directed RNA polymerase beta subunit
MIDIKKLNLFPLFTNNLSITKTDDDKSYNIIFYSENSTFFNSYPNLNIRRMFVRYGTILPSVMPRLIVMPKQLSQFYSNKILPIRANRSNLSNLFIDASPFMSKLNERYKGDSYRRPLVLTKILSYLQSAKQYYPDRANILMYHVDVSKPIPELIYNRRSFPLFMLFKQEEIPFEYVVLAIQSGSSTRYSVLKRPEKKLNTSRIFSILRNIHTIQLTDEAGNEDNEIQNYSKQVASAAQVNYDAEIVTEEPRQVVHPAMIPAVKTFVQTLPPESRRQILHQSHIDPNFAQGLLIKSSLFSVTRDAKKTNDIFSKINPKNYSSVLASIKTELGPTILEDDEYKNESRDPVYEKANVNVINKNKNPSKILNKRVIDFKTSFEEDLKKSFKILESKKTYPLKLVKFSKQSLPIDPGDLQPTKWLRYSIALKDYKGKEHTITMDIPEIDEDGTFLINGTKKFLIYQIIRDPIYFIKEGEAALQTMYATVATHHKLTKHKSYFTSHIAGYWIPTSLLMFHAVGFDYALKLFGIQYTVLSERPQERDVKYVETSDGKFLTFKTTTKEAEIFINSIYEIKGEINSSQLNNLDMWAAVLNKETGNRNSLHQIGLVLENIMEPISVEVLKTKLMPITFPGCMHYICKGLAENRIDDRNDITKQRIRSSEIFNYQIQKLIIGSYSEYLSNLEHGNTDAEYRCDAKNIVSTLISTSKMIRTVENINPYEELSSLTKITPIGPGGIADSHGVTKGARNINDSYYGNLDPMDTPENDSIGVINQLTIDAAIGNVRGSFGTHTGTDAGSSILSVATAAVPFVSNDDGCRVMFSGSQTRQAIPILGSEKPLVQTGYETIMTSMLTDAYVKKSPVNGFVIRQSPNAIYVKDGKTGKIHVVPLDSKVLKSYQGKSSINYFHSTIRDGQSVKAGQILAEGKHIQDGVISVGTNLLAAVMGWKGYSFDDGYIISEKVANEKFVSTAYDEIEIDVKATSSIKYIAKEGPTKKGEVLIIRASKEIDELLNVDDEEIVEGQYVKRSPGGKIIEIAIYPNVSIKKFPVLEPQYEIFRKRWEEIRGPFPEKFLTNEAGNKVPFSGVKIVFKIERYDSCVVGDKIANSHGGKGVLTLVEKDENMPVTPWGDRIDIIVNPIAIINRMNPGTLYEMYTGLIAKTLARKIVSLGLKKTPAAMKAISDVYNALDNTKDKALSKNIIRAYLSLNDKQYAEYVKKIESSGYSLPIIVPPFQSPSKEMITKAMNIMGLESAYHLKLPEFNTNTKNKVAVGYLYYKKLEKQAAYLASARSIGKYEAKTGQPIAGSSRGGGQRLGEFDSWALIAHGAETVLKELFGPLSDDRKTKEEILYEIMQKGSASYREPKAVVTKSILDIYMASMMLDVKL